MSSIAFIFKSAPHGSSSGREGLDALLATSSLIRRVGVFFVGDGIFQVIPNQQPELILARNYISTFKVLPLYGIKTLILCKNSLIERGLNKNIEFIINAKVITANKLRKKLLQYSHILTF